MKRNQSRRFLNHTPEAQDQESNSSFERDDIIIGLPFLDLLLRDIFKRFSCGFKMWFTGADPPERGRKITGMKNLSFVVPIGMWRVARC